MNTLQVIETCAICGVPKDDHDVDDLNGQAICHDGEVYLASDEPCWGCLGNATHWRYGEPCCDACATAANEAVRTC